jgi:hypothetical protein
MNPGGWRSRVPASGVPGISPGTFDAASGGYKGSMGGESLEQRFRRSRPHVMRAAQMTRDLGIVSASALAELAVLCEEMATRSGPPQDQYCRDLAERLRASSHRRLAFVEWENEEIRRLLGPDAPQL